MTLGISLRMQLEDAAAGIGPLCMQEASHVQLWRFFVFLACLPPIYVLANYILVGTVWFFESQFFTTTNVLYYVISLKVTSSLLSTNWLKELNSLVLKASCG